MEKLYFIGDSSSKLERIAQKAERDLFKLKSSRLMKNSIGKEFDGIISGVSKFGIYILLNDKPVEGMVPFRNMSDDFYYFIEDETYSNAFRIELTTTKQASTVKLVLYQQ